MSTTTPTAPQGLSAWEGLRLVLSRELRERSRSTPFLLGFLLTMVLLAAAIFIPQALSSGGVELRVGVLGDGGESILRVAGRIAAQDVEPDRDFTFDVVPLADEAAAAASLEAGEVELVLVDGAEILRAGSTGFSGSDLQDAVQQAAALAAVEDQLAGSGAEVDDVAATLNSEVLPVRTLQGEADAAQEEGRSFIAYGGMMLLYIAILGFGAWTLQGVVEEKSSRVIEVLLATLKPWQLLAGKVIGIGLLGLSQFVATILWALLLLRVSDAFTLPAIPLDSAVTLVVWFVLGYAVYSVLYAATGALVSRIEDAQSVAFPISLIAIVGFLVSFQALDEPMGAVARVGTYIPFMAPFVVPIRVAFQQIQVWEYLLSVALVLVTLVGMIRVAARVYAGGLLRFGGRIGLRQAWRGVERAADA